MTIIDSGDVGIMIIQQQLFLVRAPQIGLPTECNIATSGGRVNIISDKGSGWYSGSCMVRLRDEGKPPITRIQ